MKVNVTIEDVQSGVACDPHNCPVATAASRVFAGDVFVHTDGMVVRDASHEYHYDLPLRVRWSIAFFDTFGWMWPFSFNLSKPEVFAIKEAMDCGDMDCGEVPETELGIGSGSRELVSV